MELIRSLAFAVAILPLCAQQPPRTGQPSQETRREEPPPVTSPAEAALKEAIALTARGRFDEAIPRFLAARNGGAASFALDFNLSLCYVATQQFDQAVALLNRLDPRRPNVRTLLAQAHLGAGHAAEAEHVFEQAAAAEPRNERLYLQLTQSALDLGQTAFAERIVARGLQNLPRSARLHFERGILLSQLDDNQAAAADFAAARTLAPNSEIADISAAEQAFLAGNLPEVIAACRAGLRAGRSHYLLLTMLGEALLRSGSQPGSPEFDEARLALERAVTSQPGYSSAHISLGRLYLALDRLPDAITQLENGRRLEPANKAVYPPLATAYRKAGEPAKARQALAALAELNRAEADRIRNAEGGHAGYLSGRPTTQK